MGFQLASGWDRWRGSPKRRTSALGSSVSDGLDVQMRMRMGMSLLCGMVYAWSCGLYLHKLWPCCPAGIAFCIRNLHLHVNFIGEGEKTRRLRSKTDRSSDTFNEWSEKHGTKATIDKFICEIWLFIFLYNILKFHSYTTKLLLKSPSNFLYFYTN